jgi:hypothetical protein
VRLFLGGFRNALYEALHAGQVARFLLISSLQINLQPHVFCGIPLRRVPRKKGT